MKRAVTAVLMLSCALPVAAHRLDEYLQAATLTVERDRVAVQLRLTPGVAVLPAVLPEIDANGDASIDQSEQRAYAKRVQRDVSLAVDGVSEKLRVVSWKFPAVADMREGFGEIVIDLVAQLPAGGGARKLTFENRHHREMGAYLVNTLVPQDAAIHLETQQRNYTQSQYELNYSQARGTSVVNTAAWWGLGAGVILLLGRITARSSSLRHAR